MPQPDVNRVESIPRAALLDDANVLLGGQPRQPGIQVASLLKDLVELSAALGKRASPRDLESPLRKRLDAGQRQERHDCPRVDRGEPIEALSDPSQNRWNGGPVKQIVADVGYEGGGFSRGAGRQVVPQAAAPNPRQFPAQNAAPQAIRPPVPERC